MRYECLVNTIAQDGLYAEKGCDTTIKAFHAMSPAQQHNYSNAVTSFDSLDFSTPYFIAFLVSLILLAAIVGWRSVTRGLRVC